MSTSTKTCTIEIEDAAGNSRLCKFEAVWELRSAVLGGPLGPPAYRCWEHAGNALAFLMTEPTTAFIALERC